MIPLGEAKDSRTEQWRTFKASKYWSSNIWGATIAGIGGGLILLIVGAILLLDSEGSTGTAVGAALVLTVMATVLVMFPGNMIAAVPIAVELDDRTAIRLIAPLKKVYIPFKEIREVRDSMAWRLFQQGRVIKLKKRHGLMKSFVIHWAFGAAGTQLTRAIKDGISGLE